MAMGISQQISEIQDTGTNDPIVQITSGNNSGDRPNVTTLKDFQVADAPNQTGVNATLSLTTTAQEGKAGAATLTNRKYIEMYATTDKVKWGYDTTCPFDLFKNQFFSLPAGTNCKVYFKSSSGTASVVVAEK